MLGPKKIKHHSHNLLQAIMRFVAHLPSHESSG
jgi:hypothetical protein